MSFSKGSEGANGGLSSAAISMDNYGATDETNTLTSDYLVRIL